MIVSNIGNRSGFYRLYFLLLIMMVSPLHAIQKTNVESSDAVRAASVIEAFVMQRASIETGDFLLHVNHFADSFLEVEPLELALLRDVNAWHRIIFDYPNERFYYAVVVNSKLTTFNDPEKEEQIDEASENLIMGFLVDGDNRLQFRMPNRVQQISEKTPFNQIPKQFSVPDIRLFGISNFGSGDADALNASLDFLTVGDHISQIHDYKNGTKKITYRFLDTSGSEGGDGLESDYIIDLENLLTIKIVQAFIKNGERGKTWSTETITWQDINGNWIPKKVKRESRSATAINRKPHAHPLDQIANIHCFSVNEPLSDELFDIDNIRKLDNLLKMCDPAASGATQILNTTERKQ